MSTRRPAPRGGQRPEQPDTSGSPCVGSSDYFNARYSYDNVPVSVRTSTGGGLVAVGVEIDGTFVPFAWKPTRAFERDLLNA